MIYREIENVLSIDECTFLKSAFGTEIGKIDSSKMNPIQLKICEDLNNKIGLFVSDKSKIEPWTFESVAPGQNTRLADPAKGLDKKDRFQTVILFLTKTKRGGNIKFREGTQIVPEIGKLLILNNKTALDFKNDERSDFRFRSLNRGQNIVFITHVKYPN